MGIAKSTLPDVCKTPSPGGPVPIPYPIIISMSRDLKKGSKKVKFDGGNSAAIKGSEFSRCSGDEPGTAGGVKSSTNMKEATWILYSFDVKIEGKNACRLSDKMMMNHGNTACLGGVLQEPVAGLSDEAKEVADCLCNSFCDDVKRGFKKGPRGGYRKKKSYSRRHNWSYALEQELIDNPPACLGGNVTVRPQKYTDPKTVPDAVLGDVDQCFDFKYPGDRWRGDQYERQWELADKEPQEISTKTCACT